ncbi:MAG: hypothetical protein SGILL_003954 [Bacillariaceae sp.]
MTHSLLLQASNWLYQLNPTLSEIPPRADNVGEICYMGPGGSKDGAILCQDLLYSHATCVGSWMIPPKHHIVEGILVTLISILILAVAIPKLNGFANTSVLKIRHPPGARLASLFCFGMIMYYKYAGYPGRTYYIVMPCNMQWFLSFAQCFMVPTNWTWAQYTLLQLRLTYLMSVIIAIVTPETDDCILPGEYAFYWFNHLLLLILPAAYVMNGSVSCIPQQQSDAESASSWTFNLWWWTYACCVFSVFYFIPVSLLAIYSGLNLNFMLHPPHDHFALNGPWFRLVAVGMLAVLFGFSRAIVYGIERMFGLRRQGVSDVRTTKDSKKKQRMQLRQTSQSQQQSYHVVFSTSCDPFQNWQSLAFFYFANKVKQPGHITRIASGCTREKAEELQKQHQEQVLPLNREHFHLHITPDFGHGIGDRKYWNKPLGILSFLETTLGYGNQSESSSSNPHDNDVIIILDPDMMLLKPITRDFSDYVGGWENDLTHLLVQHGKPIAQRYEFGAKWLTSLNGRLAEVVGADSPAHNVTEKEADLYYPAGPPYLATGKDMYRLVTHWVEFLPKIFEIFPQFMAEMHGYSLAASHLKLPHRLARGFMVSDVHVYENFDFVDQYLNRSNACQVAAQGAAGILPTQSELHAYQRQLPLVLHFCQRYALGRFFFGKYKLNEQFFECDAPLLREPPLNVGDIYDWFIFPNNQETADFSAPAKQHDIARNAWMMCSLIFGLNDAANSFKTSHCESPNLEKIWHFHDEDKFQAMLADATNPFHNQTQVKIKT